MKCNLLICLTLSLFIAACSNSTGTDSGLFTVDIINISESVPSGTASSISRNYLPSDGNQWITPDSFVIKLGTIAINDEEGHFSKLFDAEDDADCISIDLGLGEKLTDKVDLSTVYEGEQIAWIGIALLPQIDYRYTDSNGSSHTGQIDLDIATGGNGFFYDIGEARNRAAYDVDLYEPDSGWEDTRLYFNEDSQELILYFDINNIIYDPDNDGTPELIHLDDIFIPVTDKCTVEYYYLRNADGVEEIYPYRMTILKTDSGLPVYGQLSNREFKTDMTSSYELTELNGMNISSHADRDDVLIINNDGSLDINLGNGYILSGLQAEDNQTLSINTGNIKVKYDIKY